MVVPGEFSVVYHKLSNMPSSSTNKLTELELIGLVFFIQVNSLLNWFDINDHKILTFKLNH